MRREALTSLALNIRDEERNAEILLRMFDIELVLDAGSQENEISFFLSPPYKDVKDSVDTGHHPRSQSEAILMSLARSSENLFLSTPLRLKHFSRLSPTVLRELLRSPSIRQETPDDSYTSDVSLTQQHPLLDECRNMKRPDSRRNSLFADCHCKAFPLTPPSTVELPASERFPSGQDARFVQQTLHPRSGNVMHTLPSLDLGLNPNDYDMQSRTETTAPSRDSRPRPSPRRCHMQHADTLLSSSALRNFRRVINELRGIEDDPDGRRRALVSSLRMSVVGNDLSVPSPCNPPKPTVQSNIIPVHPQLMYEEQQEVERPPHCMIYQTLPTPPCSSLRPLEQEFVGLLLQRAVDEEADAEELRMLSGRLDRLALARKNLADYIKKYERH